MAECADKNLVDKDEYPRRRSWSGVSRDLASMLLTDLGRVPPVMGGLRRPLLACVTAMVAAGCGSATTTSTSRTSTSPTSTSPTSTSPTTVAASYPTTPVSVAGEGGTAVLAAVRAAAQNGFDRVTFEFANRVPGYTVGYVERPVVQDGSGAPVAVEGAAVLKVVMTPASSVDLAAGGQPTYTGPKRFGPGTQMLAELVQVGDFEGYLTWVIGVATNGGFSVSTLASPPRLVVDVKAR